MKRNSVIFLTLTIIILFVLVYNLNIFNIFEKYELPDTFDEKCLITDDDVYTIESGNPGPHILLLGGVHGDEESGIVALKQIMNEFKSSERTLTRGRLYIIHTANKCGYDKFSRYVPGLQDADINRNFPIEKGSIDCKDAISQIILAYANDSDIVMDFHEGYDYFSKGGTNSIGSTLTTVGCNPTNKMSEYIVDELNDTIPEDYKKFAVISSDPKSPHYIDDFAIEGTLDYYCFKNNINYILTEITGKKDPKTGKHPQPLDLRVEQVKTIIDLMFMYINNNVIKQDHVCEHTGINYHGQYINEVEHECLKC